MVVFLKIISGVFLIGIGIYLGERCDEMKTWEWINTIGWIFLSFSAFFR